jgi:hypothetical protein
VDALAAIAVGGPDQARVVTGLLVDLSRGGPPALADLPRRAVDGLAALATGGPDAWRTVTELLVDLARTGSAAGGQLAAQTRRG